MGSTTHTADLGSLQPEIDLAEWMDADMAVEALDDPDDVDPLVSGGSATTIWSRTSHRVDA